MRTAIFLLVSHIVVFSCVAQEKVEVYPVTLVTRSDSFGLRWPGSTEINRYRLLINDSANYNDGALPGYAFTLFYNNDSVYVPYRNTIPYGQYTYINFINGNIRSVVRLGFDAMSAIFPQEYKVGNGKRVQFDIPEVYELANIIWTLSPSGRLATDLNKTGSYYRDVLNWFRPYLKHPVFRELAFPQNERISQYFDFRENSFAFSFKDTAAGSNDCSILFNGPYYRVYGRGLADSSLFGRLKPLVEDFAKASGFRKFYQKHRDLYARQIIRQRNILPVAQMWEWLEQHFPDSKYQSYRIVFSPLIGGSHSTQNFANYDKGVLFRECVMFICNTDRVDSLRQISEKQKEGLMSGVVFTEIDHNYVNRESNRYRASIDSIFGNRPYWVKDTATSNFYGNAMAIFNEYMTWAVFCLYMQELYDKETAAYVINERESRMMSKRGFFRFGSFNQALLKIRQEHPDLKVKALYPFILDWCRKME